MRATIIADDNSVILDGVRADVDCSALLAQGIHAVQWYDTWGEVEYKSDPATLSRPPNLRFTDFTPYQSYVSGWVQPPPPETPQPFPTSIPTPPPVQLAPPLNATS